MILAILTIKLCKKEKRFSIAVIHLQNPQVTEKSNVVINQESIYCEYSSVQ